MLLNVRVSLLVASKMVGLPLAVMTRILVGVILCG